MEEAQTAWWSQRSLRTLPAEAKEEAAQIIAARLQRAAEGLVENPSTWFAVAERYGIKIADYHALGCGRGELCTGLGNNDGTIIAVNTAYPPVEQARVWVHELAHYDLHVWMPPQLAHAADVYYYSDRAEDVRHQIAQRVEQIVMGD